MRVSRQVLLDIYLLFQQAVSMVLASHRTVQQKFPDLVSPKEEGRWSVWFSCIWFTSWSGFYQVNWMESCHLWFRWTQWSLCYSINTWNVSSQVKMKVAFHNADWNGMFICVFPQVRTKVASRDPTNTPFERLIEMKKKVSLLGFIVEGFQKVDAFFLTE